MPIRTPARKIACPCPCTASPFLSSSVAWASCAITSTTPSASKKENGLAPDTLAAARLATDMLPLAGQVQRASDTSKNAIGRLTGVVPPRFDDDETTLDELRQRIDATVAFFESIDANALTEADRKQVSLDFGKVKPSFDGVEYLLTFVLPNFYFHLATAHDILRSRGVPVGKVDYLGSFAQYE